MMLTLTTADSDRQNRGLCRKKGLLNVESGGASTVRSVASGKSRASLGPVTLAEVAPTHPEDGLERQVLAWSERMMLVRHRMRPGWKGARHSHPHEQMVYVISGHLRFARAGEVFDLRAGDSIVVAGGVEHEASALEQSEVLDFFTPFRQDYAGTQE